jgi:putative oxidoreductase
MHVGLFLIHLVVGALVAAHGAQKLFGWFGGHGPAGTAAVMESLGLRPGRAMAVTAGAGELVGGSFFAAGFFTPLAAASVAAVMLVATLTVHAGKGPWNSNGGWEYPLTIGAVAIGLAFNGAGAWSVDDAIGWDVSGLWWGIGAALLGLAGAAAVVALSRGQLAEDAGSVTSEPAGT